MAIADYVKRVVLLNQLIENKQAGTLDDIGRQLGVKKRQAAYYLEALMDLGKEAIYENKEKCFIYKADSEWNIHWPENKK